MNSNEIIVLLTANWIFTILFCIVFIILLTGFSYKKAKKIKDILISCELLSKETNYELIETEKKSYAVTLYQDKLIERMKNINHELEGYKGEIFDTQKLDTISSMINNSLIKPENENNDTNIIDFENEKSINKYQSIKNLETSKIENLKNLEYYEKSIEKYYKDDFNKPCNINNNNNNEKQTKIIPEKTEKKTFEERFNQIKQILNKKSNKEMFEIGINTFKLSEIKQKIKEV